MDIRRENQYEKSLTLYMYIIEYENILLNNLEYLSLLKNKIRCIIFKFNDIE